MSKEKLPPHDLEAEKSVLGAVLLDKDALIKVSDFLLAEHFYEIKHHDIYSAYLTLFTKGSAIDLLTVSRQLRKHKKLKKSGGRAYLTKLLEVVPTAAHVVEYANLVRDTSVRRGLISAAGSITDLAFDDSQSTEDILGLSQSSLFNVSVSGFDQGFTHVKNLLEKAYEEVARMDTSKPGEMKGISSGLVDIDKLLGGFQKSDLIILAARPSMGKTSLALDIVLHAVVVEKKKVAFFSLEMSEMQLMNRLLSKQAKVNLWDMSNGALKDQDFTKLADAVGVLSEVQLWIDDKPGQKIMEIRTKARRLFLEQEIDMVVVDYLQLIHGSTKEGRVQEVSQISMELKNIARELDIPVISLSQLSRKVEERGDKIPMLSDLRDSGSIEQDADVVMFIYREDHYNPESPRQGVADIKIAKHRNGPVGNVELSWLQEQASFQNYTGQKEN